MPGSDYRLCKFGMIVFNWRYVQQWLYIQDKQVLHVLSNATPTMMFPWNWQIWWQHDPSSRTQGLGLQFLCHKKKTAGIMHSVSVAMAQNCQNAVQMFFFPVLWKLESLPLNAASLRKSFSSCQTLPYQMIYELRSCEQWLVGLLLVALPAFQARPSRNSWNSSCFIWRGNCCVVWPRRELHTSFTLELQGEKESCFLHFFFFFVRLNFLGHSESLKRPQFLRANHASVDILYCLSVI